MIRIMFAILISITTISYGNSQDTKPLIEQKALFSLLDTLFKDFDCPNICKVYFDGKIRIIERCDNSVKEFVLNHFFIYPTDFSTEETIHYSSFLTSGSLDMDSVVVDIFDKVEFPKMDTAGLAFKDLFYKTKYENIKFINQDIPYDRNGNDTYEKAFKLRVMGRVKYGKDWYVNIYMNNIKSPSGYQGIVKFDSKMNMIEIKILQWIG